MRKNSPWFEILLSVVFLSATVYAALSDAYNLPNRWFIRDDAYYYFKVAQNISEGHGSTFDGIHSTNGYHPLWLLICIPIFALARFDLILPLRILAIVSGVLQLSTAILLYRLVRSSMSAPAGMLAAAYWAFNSYILLFLYKTGVESGIALYFVLLLLVSLQKLEMSWRSRSPALPQIALLGVLALLITLSRLDLVFFAGLIGIWIVFRGAAVRYLLPFDILAILVSAIAAFLIRLGFVAYYDAATSVLIMLSAALLVKIPTLYVLRLYDRPSTWKPLHLVARLTLAMLLSGFIMAGLLLGGGLVGLFPLYSRAVLLADAGLSFVFLLLVRFAALAFRLNPAGPPDASPLERFKAAWRGWLAEGAVFYGILAGGLSIYMIWNRLAFGTFTPISGQIKHWWGTFVHSIYGTAATSWLTFFALNPFSDFNAWAPPTTTLSDWSNRYLYREATGFGNARWQQNFWLVLGLAAVVVCLALLLSKRKSVRAMVHGGLIPLFAGAWLQVLALNVTGYASPKEWYWLAQQVALVLVGAALVNVAFSVVRGRWALAGLLIWILVAWYSLRAGYDYWRAAYDLSPYGLTPAHTPYMDVIPLLEKATRPGDVIGMTGGGNIGYLMPTRTVVNMDGLINSNEYFQSLQAGTSPDYLYDSGMRYVFANPDLLAANPYRGQYTGRLRLVFHWGGKDLMRLLPSPGP